MTISQRFAVLRSRGEKALVLFVTAGDPSLDELPQVLEALQEGGADLIEVGIPFSDPIADGPTIQASSQRALERGVTPQSVCAALARSALNVPIVAMGYYNPLHRLGLSDSALMFSQAGISGTIISDLTPEEADPWVAASRRAGLDNVFLAAPTSTDERLVEVCRRAGGFIYAVSRTGVTGAQTDPSVDARSLVTRVRARTELPICVGFGISRPDQVRAVCEYADGAVVGSWLVDLLARKWGSPTGRAELVERVRELKRATQG